MSSEACLVFRGGRGARFHYWLVISHFPQNQTFWILGKKPRAISCYVSTLRFFKIERYCGQNCTMFLSVQSLANVPSMYSNVSINRNNQHAVTSAHKTESYLNGFEHKLGKCPYKAAPTNLYYWYRFHGSHLLWLRHSQNWFGELGFEN